MVKERHYNKKRRPGRIHLLTLFFIVIFGVIVFRIVEIQILRHGYYIALAESQRLSYQDLVPERGKILVREGERLFPLVANKSYKMLYAVPKDVKGDKEEIAEKLASILYDFQKRQEEAVKKSLEETAKLNIEKENIEKEEETRKEESAEAEKIKKDELKNKILTRLLKEDDPYEPLQHRLDGETVSKINNLKIDGIFLGEEPGRFYPEGTLGAHILGFVGFDDTKKIGRYGIEEEFNDILSGKIGALGFEKDTLGRWISIGARRIEPAENGADIILTIDRTVQSIAETKLREGVLRYSAHSGTIIITEPRTGKILALSNYPTFDPNIYQVSEDVSFYRNSAISDIFEPGSVFKPIIMAAALNENKVGPDTTIIDDGPIKVAEYTIDTYNAKHHGKETMTQILENSCNVGMVKVAKMLGKETIYDYLRRFGIGDLSGITLSGEGTSRLREPAKWNIVNEATVSFGQGVALTPIQLVNAVAAIANSGVLMRPTIIDSIVKGNGETEKYEPKEIRRVISPSKAAILSAMLVSAVKNGVAKSAQIAGYNIAGKTGTAEVPKEEGGYYLSSERRIASFAGYGPVENPRFVILIVLRDPEKVMHGADTAAPLFKEIASELFNYYKVPPSE